MAVEPAQTPRAAQLREAQRAHRERKRRYLRELEKRAAGSEDAHARVAQLQEQLVQMQQETQHSLPLQQQHAQIQTQLSSYYQQPHTSNTTQVGLCLPDAQAAIFHPCFPNFVPAARACPPLELKTVEFMLRAVPPLSVAPALVSRFLTLASALVTCADRHELRNILITTVKTICAMLDRCSIIHRTRVIDVLAVFLKGNQEIYTYLNAIWSQNPSVFQYSTGPVVANVHRSPVQLSTQNDTVFVETLKAIESIASIHKSNEMIDELGDLFHTMQLDQQNADQHFIRIMELNHDFAIKCSVTELSKVLYR
ncbi:hypothetical protein HDU82_009199 [Entophlyctis luteolus]|nr:hypothetical protein HDU82_009199 [Entophlyctis luteolus]